MATTINTRSELIAYYLLGSGMCTTEPVNFSEYGNELIILAEKIKAERAVIAMNNNCNNV